jgi:Rrf2 family protein
MQITRASDYAVRVMIHLSTLAAGYTVQQSMLAKATDVPTNFLSKVLQRLVRAGMVRSQRGSGGGFALAIPAARVSLLDVVQAIEGPIRLNQCLIEGPTCERKSWCPAHQVWIETQEAVVTILGAASMERLAAQTMSEGAYREHASRVDAIRGGARRTRSQA